MSIGSQIKSWIQKGVTMKKQLVILMILLLVFVGCRRQERKPQMMNQAEQTVSQPVENQRNEEIVEVEENKVGEAKVSKEIEEIQGVEEFQTRDTKETEDIMSEFSTLSGTKYLQCTPATLRAFYGISVPDEFLKVAYLDGERIEFSYDSYPTEMEPSYTLMDCYVNEGGTALILFVEKDGERLVLENDEAPVEGKVSLRLNYSELLNSFGR